MIINKDIFNNSVFAKVETENQENFNNGHFDYSLNRDTHKKYNLILYLSCVIIATLIFILVYGYKILNVCYEDWLLYRCDDLTQHYLGWKAYRLSKWNFPIGMIDNVIKPYKLSIYFMDSIPIVSLFFKTISNFLPEKFQFTGLYGLTCFILTAIFVARILSKFIKNILYIVLSVCFVLLLPVLYERMFAHTALASHWIIIYGLYYIFNYKYNKKISISFLLIFPILSSSIHLYFFPMNFIIIFAYALLYGLYHKKISLFFMIILLYIIISLFIVYIFGGFNTVTYLTDDSIGNSTLNLNSLFQSLGRSRFIKALPTHLIFASESFIYVGLGGMFIILIAFINMLFVYKFNIIYKHNKEQVIILLLVMLCSILVSILPNVYFNDKMLLSIKFPNFIQYFFNIFRSNSRFIWVGYYTGFIALLIIIGKNFKTKLAIVFLSVSVLLQTYDYWNVLYNIIHKYYTRDLVYESPLDMEVWEKVFSDKKIKNLVYLTVLFGPDRLPISIFCLDNNISTNSIYCARPIELADAYNDNVIKMVNNNPNDTVFLMKKDMFVGNIFANRKIVETGDYILFYPYK